MISWLFYLTGSYTFAKLWFSTVGYWGSIIAYAFPWILAICQIAQTNKGTTDWFPGVWTLTLYVVGLILWIVHAFAHILLVPSFVDHINHDLNPEKCIFKRKSLIPRAYYR